MSAQGMIVTLLATQLAEAVAKDQTPEAGGCDLAAGMFGPNVSQWLREMAAVQDAKNPDRKDYMPVIGTPFAIRMDVLSEQRAQKFHSQSLIRLRDRGGLNFVEAANLLPSNEPRFRDRKTTDAALALVDVCVPTDEERKQIIYALERAERRNQELADKLHDQHDYSAEFPAADADQIRKAIGLLSINKEPGK
jgi:hypothetical protein